MKINSSLYQDGKLILICMDNKLINNKIEFLFNKYTWSGNRFDLNRTFMYKYRLKRWVNKYIYGDCVIDEIYPDKFIFRFTTKKVSKS